MDDPVGIIEDHYVRSWSLMGGAVGGELIERPDLLVARAALDHAPYNHVLRCRPQDDDPDALVDEIWGLLGPREAVWTVTTRCAPADLGDRLLARGCTPYSTLTGMTRDLAGLTADAPVGTHVEEVTEETLDTWIDLVLDHWHLSADDRAILVAMHHEFGFDMVRRFLCFEDGVAVARASISVFDPEWIGLYGVGTRPEFRGRGHGTAVTLAALCAGRDSGAARALLTSTPMAVGVYEALGFEPHCTMPVYLKPASGATEPTPKERMSRM